MIAGRPTLLHRLDWIARAAFPVASAAVAVILLSMPLGLPGQTALLPATVLACVFFWTVHRPRTMHPLAAFLLGLLADLMGAGAIGILTVGVLIAQGLALQWRRVLGRHEFLIEWLAFCAIALVFSGWVWTLDSLFALMLLPPGPVLFQAALAAGVYPVLAVILVVAHTRVVEGEAA